MRPLSRIARKNFSSSSIGAAFSQPSFWSTAAADREAIEHSFEGYVQKAYKANGVVFACILTRLLVFSEARFAYQSMAGGRPGELFGDDSLSLLEAPWPNGTTGELLARMEQDVSLAGNFFATTVGTGANRRIRRMRPDWVTIVSGVKGEPEGDPWDLDAEVLAYIYDPKIKTARSRGPVVLTPDQVVHYSPIPDPEAQWRGMSWLTPVVREIQADTAATKHKLKFFENGAAPSFAVSYDAQISPEALALFVEKFKHAHQGVDNAYKTFHLGGGADITTVGADLKQLDFKVTQGAGETRIAAAAGVPPVIVGLSEGLQSATYSNYGQARRRLADGTTRPLWRMAAGSLTKFAAPPKGSRLWVDTRDVAFLREDEKDAAAILKERMLTIESAVRSGYQPESAVAAIEAGDLSLLKHTGLYSVQLQPPGRSAPSPTPPTPGDQPVEP